MVSSSMSWQPDCKIRSGRNGQRDDVWWSHRVISSWLSASSSACRAVNDIRDNAIAYKPSATKMPENWSWRTRQLLTCRCVSVWCCCARQNTRRLADAKAENDALRDDVAAGRHRLHQSSLSVSAWSHHASGVNVLTSPDWQTPLNGIISPSERAEDHYAKTTGRNPEVY